MDGVLIGFFFSTPISNTPEDSRAEDPSEQSVYQVSLCEGPRLLGVEGGGTGGRGV